MLTGLLLVLLALVGIIAIMVWIVQLPFVALLINIGLIALAAWIVRGPFVALLAIIGFVAIILSAVRWARDIRRYRTATPDVGTALDVLNARYARGDIDQAEYREKRALIASTTAAAAANGATNRSHASIASDSTKHAPPHAALALAASRCRHHTANAWAAIAANTVT